MAVHIGKVTSEVVPEPEPPAGAAGGPGHRWQDVDELRDIALQLIRDQLRTGAEVFND